MKTLNVDGSKSKIGANLMENKYGDFYSTVEVPRHATKKANMSCWDQIDTIAEDAIKQIASFAGVDVEEFGDCAIYKEAVDLMTSSIEERFNVKFQYVEGNY